MAQPGKHQQLAGLMKEDSEKMEPHHHHKEDEQKGDSYRDLFRKGDDPSNETCQVVRKKDGEKSAKKEPQEGCNLFKKSSFQAVNDNAQDDGREEKINQGQELFSL